MAKRIKDKQSSTKHTHRPNDGLTRTLLKAGCELRCYFETIFWNTSNTCLYFYTNFRTQMYDNQCCYNDSGLLMNPQALFGSGYANRYHYAGDNLDNIPFLSNFIYDVIPYQHCCVYPLQDANTNAYTGCDVFYARRPPNSCVNYVPPVVGKLWKESLNSDIKKYQKQNEQLPLTLNHQTWIGPRRMVLEIPVPACNRDNNLACCVQCLVSLDSIITQFVCLRIPI